MASQETTVVAPGSEEQKVEEVVSEDGKTKARPRKLVDVLPPKKFLEIEEQATDDESVRSQTVFMELCRVFLGIMKNGESSNVKTKKIALYKLFPKLVNLSLSFLTAEHSQFFMRILVRGCKIEWGSEKLKILNFEPYLKLTTDFIKSGGLVLSTGD